MWVVIFLIFTNVKAFNCYDASSCVGWGIVVNDVTVSCYGFDSCREADITSFSGEIRCYGSYGCYESSLITTDDVISCSGLFSCGFANVYTADGDLECYGESSCSNIVANVTGYSECNGAFSCQNAILHGGCDASCCCRILYMYGYKSCLNCTIYGLQYTTVMFAGVSSGMGSVVICSGTCVIDCYLDGCNNVTLLCAANSTNCQFEVTCSEDADKVGICSNNNNNDSNSINTFSSYGTNDYDNDDKYDDINIYLTSLFDVIDIEEYSNFSVFSSYDDGYSCCDNNSSNNLHYDNYPKDTSNSFTSLNNTLCCRGSSSCSTTVSSLDSIDTEKKVLRLDGYVANGGSTLTWYNNVYATGQLSKYSGSATGGDSSQIVCSGTGSCGDSNLDNWDNVYAMSATSMYTTDIWTTGDGQVSSVGNIWNYGYQAAREITISNVSRNIYCYCELSCQAADISNVGGNIIARGKEALINGNIYSVNGDIYGFGSYVLSSSTIINASTV